MLYIHVHEEDVYDTMPVNEFGDDDHPLKKQLDTNDVFCQSQKKYKNQPILDG